MLCALRVVVVMVTDVGMGGCGSWSLVDVFTVDVLGGGRGWAASPAGGVFLFQAVQFQARLQFAEETHDGRLLEGDGRGFVAAVLPGGCRVLGAVSQVGSEPNEEAKGYSYDTGLECRQKDGEGLFVKQRW